MGATTMSNATQRNFSAAVGERDRRNARIAEGEDPILLAQANYLGPGWDAFYGSLHDQADAANAAGLNFHTDLSGVGQYPGSLHAFQQGGGVQYPSDAGAVRGNVALGALADENGLRQLQHRAAVDVNQQDAIRAMQHAYDDQVDASLNAPPITDRIVATGKDGLKSGGVYSTEPASTDPRQQWFDKLPMPVRMAYEKQQADIDAQRTNTTLNVRRENAAEASNPLLTTFRGTDGKPLALTDEHGAPLQGDAALAKLPATVRNQVQGVLDGRQMLPSGTASKDPYWKSIIQLANQVDPSFDAVNFNARAATRKDFTSGPTSKNINAINTAIGHLSDFSDAADKLGNGGYDWVNAGKNKITPGGSERGVALNNFNTIKNGLTSELTRVWRQAGGTEQDIKDWAATIGDSKSPEELRGAMSTIGGMLESKLNALQDQYRQGMGTDAVSVISAQARAHLDKLQGRAQKAAPSGGAPAAGGGGIIVTDPSGGRHVFTDQAKADAFKKAAGIQ
jgi:hypothetical protein